MLIHPAADGIKTKRGAALFIMRVRATLMADEDQGDFHSAENCILFRDNLLDRWGEPERADALQAIAWLGTDWASLYGIALRDTDKGSFDESGAEVEIRSGHYKRRVLACRAIWAEMNPTPEEREAVKLWLAGRQGSWR